jgi:hypothetical protein
LCWYGLCSTPPPMTNICVFWRRGCQNSPGRSAGSGYVACRRAERSARKAPAGRTRARTTGPRRSRRLRRDSRSPRPSWRFSTS